MTKHKFQFLSMLLIFLLFVVGCDIDSFAEVPTDTPDPCAHIDCPTPPPCPTSQPCTEFSDIFTEKLNSILWIQSSSEYQMVTTQSYLLAKVMLDRGLADPNWTAAVEQTGNYSNLPPAIILDVDETVLDNSGFQARLEKAGKGWDNEIWNNWVLESKAPAVPGALEFLNYANSKGVIIFYMTNRSHELEEATRSNLISLGFPMSEEIDTLLTNGEQEDWVTDKTSRRKLVADGYRILLLFGDVTNDFVAGTDNIRSEECMDVMNSYHEYWGEKWIVIPNPIYGGWESATYNFDYSLSRREKVDIKFKFMDTLE